MLYPQRIATLALPLRRQWRDLPNHLDCCCDLTSGCKYKNTTDFNSSGCSYQREPIWLQTPRQDRRLELASTVTPSSPRGWRRLVSWPAHWLRVTKANTARNETCGLNFDAQRTQPMPLARKIYAMAWKKYQHIAKSPNKRSSCSNSWWSKGWSAIKRREYVNVKKFFSRKMHRRKEATEISGNRSSRFKLIAQRESSWDFAAITCTWYGKNALVKCCFHGKTWGAQKTIW